MPDRHLVYKKLEEILKQLKNLKNEVPINYSLSFIELGRLDILPASFVEKLGQCTTVRNILVHEYQELDLKKFRGAVKSALRDFPKYVKYIDKFIDSN